MTFNVGRFKESLARFGYLDNNSFEVFVQTPPILIGGNQNAAMQIAENMSFRIDQVRAPGISLITADINRYGTGPTQKMPTSAQFQEVNISVLGDHYCEFWQYWYNWTRAVFEFNAAPGGTPSYTAQYKNGQNGYSSIIMIQIYDHFGNPIQTINLFEAFPTAVREVPLSWGDGNLMKINVSLAYTEYTIDSVTSARPNNSIRSRQTQQ